MRPGSGCGYREACCHGMLSSHRGRVVTEKESDVVKRKQQVERKLGLSGWSELSGLS